MFLKRTIGNGRATKSQVKNEIIRIHGKGNRTNHEIDAIAIYHAYKIFVSGLIKDKDLIRKIKGRIFNV